MYALGLRAAGTAQRNGEPWLAAMQDSTGVAIFARSLQGQIYGGLRERIRASPGEGCNSVAIALLMSISLISPSSTLASTRI
jgi:hypothetical protein